MKITLLMAIEILRKALCPVSRQSYGDNSCPLVYRSSKTRLVCHFKSSELNTNLCGTFPGSGPMIQVTVVAAWNVEHPPYFCLAAYG